MNCAIDVVVIIVIVVVMVRDMIGMFDQMLDDEFRSVAVTAQYMRETTFRSGSRLPRKYQHQ